jgi:hypothetical protein
MRAYSVAILAGLTLIAAAVLVNVFPPESEGPEMLSGALEVPGPAAMPAPALAPAPEIATAAESEPEDELAEAALDARVEPAPIEQALTPDLVSTENDEDVKERTGLRIALNQDEEARLAAEPVDPDWAPRTEVLIDAILRSNQVFLEFEDIDIECRTTICRVKIIHKAVFVPPEGEFGLEAEVSMLLRPVIEQNYPRIRGSTGTTKFPQSDDERMVTDIYLVSGTN